MNHEINIDYAKIHLTAKKGIHRAAVFMGLGVNAANFKELKDHQLVHDTKFNILPEKVSDEVLKEWKSEFRLWVVRCGFRELVDYLCVYFDRVYHVSSLIVRKYSEVAQAKFERVGLDTKIALLEKDFGITYTFGTQLGSFYPVRNCFAHRLGRVGPEDLKDGMDRLVLQYMHFVSVFTPEGGIERVIPDIFDPSSPPFEAEAAGTLGMKWCLEELKFQSGEVINLTPKSLTEVLFFADLAAAEFTKSALAFAKANGVRFKDEPPTNEGCHGG